MFFETQGTWCWIVMTSLCLTLPWVLHCLDRLVWGEGNETQPVSQELVAENGGVGLKLNPVDRHRRSFGDPNPSDSVCHTQVCILQLEFDHFVGNFGDGHRRLVGVRHLESADTQALLWFFYGLNTHRIIFEDTRIIFDTGGSITAGSSPFAGSSGTQSYFTKPHRLHSPHAPSSTASIVLEAKEIASRLSSRLQGLFFKNFFNITNSTQRVEVLRGRMSPKFVSEIRPV